MYLLDTNVISELRPDKPQASPEVLAWAASVPLKAQYTSPLCLMEIEIGILRLERRQPPEGKALRAWLDLVRQLFSPRLLVVDDKVCQRCAPLHVPNCRIPDDWIDTKRYALFMARDVMRALIDQMQSASVPSSS